MKRTVQRKVAAFLSVLALLPSGHLAVAQDAPGIRRNEALGARGGTVTGTVSRANGSPVANASLQLRDVATARIAAFTRADATGRFTFARVSPGRYVVELVDENHAVLALGELFTIGPTETVATFLRLGAQASWFGGFFGNVAAAAIAAAVTMGVMAVGHGGQPASARS
jgi:hypothetical protein